MAEFGDVDTLIMYFGIAALFAIGAIIYLYFFQKKHPKPLESEYSHLSGNAVWQFLGDEGAGYTSKAIGPAVVNEGLVTTILEDGTKLVNLDIDEVRYPKKSWNIALGAGVYPVFCNRDRTNIRRNWQNISEERLMHLSQKTIEKYRTQAKIDIMHMAEMKDKRKGEDRGMYEEILSRREE